MTNRPLATRALRVVLMCACRLLRAGLGGDTYKSRSPGGGRSSAMFSDPMPERIEPCLALLSGKAPAGDDWAFEVKWDGFRLAIHIGPSQKVRIITRGGHDWTSRFPTIAHDALELVVDSAILDGEAVVLDEPGASDFGALQKAFGGRRGKRSAAGAMLYSFDLLYLNGHDPRSMPFSERREMLQDMLSFQPHGSIRLVRRSTPRVAKRVRGMHRGRSTRRADGVDRPVSCQTPTLEGKSSPFRERRQDRSDP